MKIRIFHLTIAVLVALIGLILLENYVSLAAPAQHSSTELGVITPQDEPDLEIRARRAISIPFGIDSPLELQEAGRQVVVTGHGTCQEGGESVKIRVTVTQESTHARAKGRTSEDCLNGAELFWETEAQLQGPRTFNPGEGEACAMAIVSVPGGGNVTQKWCKAVILQ